MRLTATSFTPTTPPATATVGIDALVAQFREAVAAADAVGAACAPYEDASAPLGVAARELRADALDALASRIAGARIPFPVDLEQSIAGASPQVVTDLHAEWAARITAFTAERAAPYYREAARGYGRVLAIDPTNARALAQLADYRDDFLRSCR